MTQAEKSARAKAAARYTDKIRNLNKRVYAVRYWNFLMGFSHEPERGDLGYMAAQGVRMHLNGLWEGAAP